MTQTLSPKPFIFLLITLGVIGFSTAYSLEQQEIAKAKINQEQVVWK